MAGSAGQAQRSIRALRNGIQSRRRVLSVVTANTTGDQPTFPHALDMLNATRPALAVLLTTSAPHSGDDVRCSYTQRAPCAPTACNSIPPNANSLLLPSVTDLRSAIQARLQVAMRRHDPKGCTPVPVVTAELGDYFINLVAPSASLFVRLAVADEPLTGVRAGEFAETAYSLRTSYLGWGRCAL